MTQIVYREVDPCPALSEYIFNYWFFSYTDNPTHLQPPKTISHIIPPDACTSLVFMKNACLDIERQFITPASAKEMKTSIPASSVFLGIRIMPGAGKAVLGDDLGTLSENSRYHWMKQLGLCFVQDNLSIDFNQFNAIDSALKHYVREQSYPVDHSLLKIINRIIALKGQIQVQDLCNEFNIHERKLQRLFSQKVGLTPVEFIRIRKVRAAIIDFVLDSKSYSSIAADRGFVDQSHLIKELKKITGEKPSTLQAYLSQIEHIGNIR